MSLAVYIYSGTCSECGKAYKVVLMTDVERGVENPLSARCDNLTEHGTRTSEIVHFGLEAVT